MKKLNIEIDGKELEYNIPESWNEVTVKQFSELFQVDEDLHRIQKIVKNIGILCGIEEEILNEFKPTDFNTLAENINFINTDVPVVIKDKLECGGEVFYMKDDFKSLTFGEMSTIEILLEKNNQNIMGCMDDLLCVFLRKKVDGKLEKFTTELFERKELFGQLPIDEVYNLFGFFLNTLNP